MQKQGSVIILAAGYSSRMGSPKFALSLDSQTNFLENIIQQYFKIGTQNIIIVINSEGEKYLERHPLKISEPIQFIINKHPELERFHSIKLGLSAIKKTSYAFIHPTDLPVVKPETLEMIYKNKEEANFVKPVFQNNGGHPILLSPLLIDKIVKEKSEQWKLNEFLKAYSSFSVEVDDAGVLDNINTWEEYMRFIERNSS